MNIEGFMLSHMQSIIICCIISKISLYWLVIIIFVLNTLFWRIARNISPRTWTRSIWAPNYINVRIRKVVTKLDFMETGIKKSQCSDTMGGECWLDQVLYQQYQVYKEIIARMKDFMTFGFIISLMTSGLQ